MSKRRAYRAVSAETSHIEEDCKDGCIHHANCNCCRYRWSENLFILSLPWTCSKL